MASTQYMLPLSVLVQAFTNVGAIAAGATITTLVAGSVSTLATTYADSGGLVPNPNPMTLNSAGRPSGQSGAIAAFWVPSGTTVDVYFTDLLGESWSIKNMVGINDPSGAGALQTSLSSPASSNAAGAGPVAGADLVANAIKSYDTFADVRAANTPTLVLNQTLSIQVQGGLSINDGLGGDFYWNSTSAATDNGTTVFKPNGNTGNGRWLRLYTPPFGALSQVLSASTTDLGTAGTNLVQVTGNATITSFGSSASAAHPLYVLTFQAAALLTYNATSMILPGAANIICATGDTAIALYLGGGNWQVLAYFRSQSSPVGPLYIDKPTTQNVASSTTLVNDTALTAPLVGGTYLVQLRLLMFGNGATSQGYKVQLTFTGTLGSGSSGAGIISGNGTPSPVLTALNAPVTSAAVADAGTPDVVNLDFLVPVSVAGQLTVQFAQNTSSANATQLFGGSIMAITKVV